jgi:cell division protein FtsB
MADDSYRIRQDILHDHMEHIQDLARDNEALTTQLEAAKSEIGRLSLKVEWLEDELDELKANRNGVQLPVVRLVADEAKRLPFTFSKTGALPPGVYSGS